MKRFWRAEERERRPLVGCCSISISISCCSLPAAIGLAVTGLLIWLGIRLGMEERNRRIQASPPR